MHVRANETAITRKPAKKEDDEKAEGAGAIRFQEAQKISNKGKQKREKRAKNECMWRKSGE